ncbi:F-box domain protein [Aspergillus homomorphus CBS 101889]|uniref:F-box domain-containing protein n=1 Tax=Aspergillus homomorphus (strain CBS 101889) TaxID=1450537 RepID=A0A395I6D2_ASPHC|nr:hypothetical protein BO97DRAFT_468302 [Aspergillus homomorphus CBS 101889]RAL15356.1 hypothetical protein BO97DRAFT_468302 [Aspergillus homomorphus CBS 101889]
MMASQLSCLEKLPNEILDEIVSYLPVTTPSESKLHHQPGICLTASDTQNLKNVAQVSSRLLELVRPRLYGHSRFHLDDLYDFLDFVSTHELERYIVSLVVLVENGSPRDLDTNRLLRLLSNLNPLRITVLAPPSRIGTMLSTKAPDEHSWAFQISHQLLQWERGTLPESSVLTTKPSCSPLDQRTYSSLSFNEGSSLRAYAHYEYFLFEVPSVLGKWGTTASMGAEEEKLSISNALQHLTSFSYTAIFPFYNHVKLVLDALELMTNLQSFTIQLAPCADDTAIDLTNRGPIDPNDPWMELATGYDIIAHSIIELGRSASLVHFRTLDYQNDALRVELHQALGAQFKGTEWLPNGRGAWNRTKLNLNIEINLGYRIRLLQCSNPSLFTYVISQWSLSAYTYLTDSPCLAVKSLLIRPTMDPASNSYAVEPAYPVLAHNLLACGNTRSNAPQPTHETDLSHSAHKAESWKLQADIDAGLQASPDSVFRPGSVIGFSRLRNKGSEDTEDDEYIGQLPRALLTAHLVHQARTPNNPSPTTVFIIHPATFNAFSPRKLLASLLHSTVTTNHEPLTRDTAIACLNRVQLFPVFDLNAATQAIHEVTASVTAGSHESSQQRTILLVAGLDNLAEGVVRTSNAARGAAALTTALRTLTHLTRTQSSTASVLLVNTSGLGTAATTNSANYASGPMRDELLSGQGSGSSGIFSAFAGNMAGLFPSLLTRTLDQGVDTHLLVSTITGVGMVVEVVKDRAGEGVGKWCVWKEMRTGPR